MPYQPLLELTEAELVGDARDTHPACGYGAVKELGQAKGELGEATRRKRTYPTHSPPLR
jgi:hypothetical protein